MRENLKNAGYSLEEIYFKMLNDELIRKLKARTDTQPKNENKKISEDEIKNEDLDKAS